MLSFLSEVSIAPGWLWVSFTIGVLILIVIDLSLFGKFGHKLSSRTALMESAVWVAISLAFNAWFAFNFGSEKGIEFLTGYLVEKSLSVDNLFVILLIFNSFKIPDGYQHRVLFYGVLGAIILRAFFIIVGAHLLHTFHWILFVFGVILLVTAVKFLFDTDEKIDAQENWALRVLRRIMPISTDRSNGRFFVREDGIRKATPLFLALVVIEATDVVFAVDSIPAVFAVTQDGFVAFSSNILAVLGLRALYFVIADWVGKLRYLKPGLAAVLGFIGIKMLVAEIFKIPSWISLLVIFSILTTAGLSSWYVARVEARRKEKSDPFAS